MEENVNQEQIFDLTGGLLCLDFANTVDDRTEIQSPFAVAHSGFCKVCSPRFQIGPWPAVGGLFWCVPRG